MKETDGSRPKAGRAGGARVAKKKRIVPLEPSYQRGKQTRETIVAAAETILVRHGHSGFTMKRVADCAGIAVGNLSYHFPTKDSLLELLVDQTLAEYSRRIDNLFPKRPVSEAAMLAELVGWFMEDSTSTRYTHLFRELWAAALHSPSLSLALERFYDRSIADVLQLVESATGRKGGADLKAIVYLICAISEGSSVLFGSKARSARLFADLKQLARRAVARLAEEATA